MLVNCAVYKNGVKLADIGVADIGRYLSMPDCFVWVALHDPAQDELAEIQAAFELHPLAVEDAHSGHERPKVEEYGDSVFVVLHLLDAGAIAKAPLEVERRRSGHYLGELDIFAGLNYVVSVRNRSAHTFADVRERCEREPELLRAGPGFVLYALMDAVVDSYFPAIDAFEVELGVIEDQIFTKGSARESLQRLYALKQRLTVLKHAVAPLLVGTGRLYGGRVPQICVGSQPYFRDVMDHLSRINATIDSVRDTIGTAIHANLSMVTIEDGEVTKRLAAWAAIFGVCTAFAGIWGMNFDFMPELKWRYGYAAALGLIASICGYLYWRFRKAGWV